MPTFEKILPNPYNYDKLYQDIQVQYPSAVMTLREFRLEVTHENADSGVLDTIIAAHNPAILTPQQQQAVVQASAKTQAAAIPNWATWDEAQVLTWFDTNITNALPAANLAAANVVLGNMATAQRAMARMIVALRNAQYPDLQSD